MNILHLNTYLRGGAATAARRLHERLVRCGSASLLGHRPGIIGPDRTYLPMFRQRSGLPDLLHRLHYRLPVWGFPRAFLQGRPAGYEQFSFCKNPFDCRLDLGRHAADIINLNWIADWLDYPSFFGFLPAGFPLVWTLHDMNAFTGGCHYSWDCDRFKTGCGDCPQLNHRRNPRDPSRANAALKRRLLAGRNLHIVANSRWLEARARESFALRDSRSYRTIHCGLDTEVFSPQDRAQCRRLLGVPEDAVVVCFGAESIDNRRKGFALLRQALERVAARHRVHALYFGGKGAGLLPATMGQTYVGTIDSAHTQAQVYSAADLFVIPSLYEAFGLTALESMACGVPVVGFATGGIPDMVEPGATGLLARPADPADLATRIEYLIGHAEERQAMGRRARARVEERFTEAIQAEKYLALFESILAERRKSR
jgi:glycosyltransferase involved in cell wall biosynthesis